MTALTWPASLLAAASVIDNPWCVCLNRSAEVGKHLAQVLRSRQQVCRHHDPLLLLTGKYYAHFCFVDLVLGCLNVIMIQALLEKSLRIWQG